MKKINTFRPKGKKNKHCYIFLLKLFELFLEILFFARLNFNQIFY